MAMDKEVQKELERTRNRSIDFNPEIGSSAPASDANVTGVDNMQIYESGGTYYMAIRINGVPYQVALTAS